MSGGRRDETPDTGAGAGLIRASWIATAVFAATAGGAAVAPDVLGGVALAVALALFFGGIVVFVWSYAVAVGRSRAEEIAVTSLFLLAGSAPNRVRARLLGSLAVETIVALATAAARPFTSLAFGVLAPLFGLALAGLWSARHGTFPPRHPPAGRRRRA